MKIKNCPYCFSDQTYVLQNGSTTLWQVQCLGCLKHGLGSETKDAAVKLWNEMVSKIKLNKGI